MNIGKLKKANMVVAEAVRETNRPERNVKLLYKLKVDSVFSGTDGLPKAFFSGDIWTFDSTGHTTGQPLKVFNIVIDLHDLADENALAERIAKTIEGNLFSSMRQITGEGKPDKLLWLDEEKLAAIHCPEENFITIAVTIKFLHYM